GNYDGAREHNAAAAKADEDYAAATGAQGMYMMMYYSHNLHFGAIAASMQGRCAEARHSAERLAENLRPALKEMPMVEPFIFMPPVETRSWQIFHIADSVLLARIAAAKGDRPAAIRALRDAVAMQDQLRYDEPADWYYPVRESLGGMLLQAGDVKAAEQVFRD